MQSAAVLALGTGVGHRHGASPSAAAGEQVSESLAIWVLLLHCIYVRLHVKENQIACAYVSAMGWYMRSSGQACAHPGVAAPAASRDALAWRGVVWHGVAWYSMVCHGVPWLGVRCRGMPPLPQPGCLIILMNRSSARSHLSSQQLSPAKLVRNLCVFSPNLLKADLYLPVLSQYCHRILLLSQGSSLACLQRTNIFPRAAFSLAKAAELCCSSVLSLGYWDGSSQSYLHEIKLYCTVGSFNVNEMFPGRRN